MAGHAHHHHHGPVGARPADERALRLALILIGVFMAGEFAAGLLASSLALLADAAHMLGDVAALGVSLVAARLVRRPAHGALTFGFGRAEILSAQVNGILLGALAVLIVVEAITRLVSPGRPDGTVMLVVALVGAAVNLAAVRGMHGQGERSLNVEGSFQHLLTDLYAFLMTAVAAVVILTTGFHRADPIASLLVAGLMLRAAGPLLRESARVFMEAAPTGLDPGEIGHALAAQPGVIEVHDLHVWEVTSGFPALSAHVLVAAGDDCHARRHELQALLHGRFGIDHTTLQVDHEGAPQGPIQIETRQR